MRENHGWKLCKGPTNEAANKQKIKQFNSKEYNQKTT